LSLPGTVAATPIKQPEAEALRSIPDRALYAIYALALVASVSVWFVALRAPLWLDETGSFQQIAGGFAAIPSRQGLATPAYSYILWFCTKLLGTSEIALRVPEILAMLGAVYLLYRSARELFDRDVAIIAAVIFCIHPLVSFEAIDARPYAFAALAINAAIFCLVRLRRSDSNWLAALFGFASASIIYFHFLFAVILPGLAIGFFLIKQGDRRVLWRQFGIALAVFTLVFLPAIPWMRSMFQTSGTHVFDEAPKWSELSFTLAPFPLEFIFLGAAFLAAATRRLELRSLLEGRRLLLCASLGLLPVLVLFGLSVQTPLHVFVPRYRLVAIPGIALCWTALLCLVNSRALRLLLCVVLVAMTAYHDFTWPLGRLHGYSWKYALEAAENDASRDGAPVLICSDFCESNYQPLPVSDAVKQSALYAPLTYYKLSVPVVALPRELNDEARRIGVNFLLQAQQHHQRFLALGYIASYDTLRWLSQSASQSYSVRVLGDPDGVAVLEFTPLPPAGDSP
jgi:Dolichyl-phosphate-mannose-protein mannosyltransferase